MVFAKALFARYDITIIIIIIITHGILANVPENECTLLKEKKFKKYVTRHKVMKH